MSRNCNPVMHELKLRSGYFDDVRLGTKTFEVRNNDRDYRLGDLLKLKEIVSYTATSSENKYSGREVVARIKYILSGEEFGIKKDYVVLGIELLSRNEVGDGDA